MFPELVMFLDVVVRLVMCLGVVNEVSRVG
jgi:hypothetical protein